MTIDKSDACLTAALNLFIDQQQLPDHYIDTIQNHLLPLASSIASLKKDKTVVVGINGAQGSGKSTMARVLAIILKQRYGLRVATLSIDDLYLIREQRLNLASKSHPLFKTRGVPGTHDVKLGLDIINRLIHERGRVKLPRFDKSIDDRLDVSLWPSVEAPVDIILFEGWCVATPPQPSLQLTEPVNELELLEDREGIWRGLVNEALSSHYRDLFASIDLLLFIKVPDFDSALKWRSKQEQQTFDQQQLQGRAMDKQEMKRFIQFFERLTSYNLAHMGELADIIFELNEEQKVIKSYYRKEHKHPHQK